MKRDMELVREILTAIRARADLKPRMLKIEDRNNLVVQRHVEMLFEAGLLQGRRHKNLQQGSCPEIFVTDISWEGHDFLAALENEDVWKKIKSTFSAGELTSLPLSVLKDVGLSLLKEWGRTKLGIPEN